MRRALLVAVTGLLALAVGFMLVAAILAVYALLKVVG